MSAPRRFLSIERVFKRFESQGRRFLALRDVTARVARFLLDEARRGAGDTIELPGTREEIGARLGTVRELVSRALSQLRVSGVIALRGRTVRVLDAVRLAALAGRGRVEAPASSRYRA